MTAPAAGEAIGKGRAGQREGSKRQRREGRLLLRVHEPTYQRRDLIGFGIKREVSGVEYVDLRVRYVLAVAFRLSEIEREIVPAPEDQSLGCVLCSHSCQFG